MRRTFLTVMVMVIAIALAATVAIAAEVITCDGGRCEGTPERDEIIGSDDADDIRALASVDIVEAHDGNDEVSLGSGGTPSDVEFVEGGRGNDKLSGGRGGDELYDFVPSDIEDTDKLLGGRNDDFLFAEDGDDNDILNGGPGADDCYGDSGDKYLYCENINGTSSISRASGDPTPRVASDLLP